MSVVIEAIYKGQTFDVEVFHDGHIEVPGSELEYEQGQGFNWPPLGATP